MKKHFSFKRITAASLAIVLAAVSLPSAHEAYAKVYGSQSGYTTATPSETNYIEKNEAETTRTAVRLTASNPTAATPTEATPADATLAAATPTEATPTELNLIELAAEETIEVSSLDELLKAIDTLNKAQGGIISMTADINLGNKQKIDIIKDIRILGNDHTLTGGTALHVKSGGTLRLGDSQGENVFIFDGTYSGAEESMVVVEKNSSLVMYPGTTLKNRSSGESGIFTKRDAGGVGVYNGTFVMYGGSIENCKGYYSGGVYVDGGKFYMYDGIISKCLGQDYGAVCLDSGQFEMSGGTIQECSYPGDSSRVRYAGGVALFSKSNMNMSGVSTIENCTGSTGGVYVDSKAVLYMTDYSRISGCTAKSEKAAGGIY